MFLLLGCLIAAITGASKYAEYRVLLRKEKIKNGPFAVAGIVMNGEEENLKQKMLLWGGLALAGAAGLFAFIYQSTKRKTG